jgi:signal transduction histidine kinase
MKVDLQRLWKTVQRQEREQLIHRMAAGLAHQLRNSLTGAKMAIDIVASGQRDQNQSSEALEVATREIQRTEGYVQRILSLSSKREMDSRPQSVHECLRPVRESLRLIAEHHHVKLDWDMKLQSQEIVVSDGAALASAIENLVLNALQAGGTQIGVVVNREESQVGAPLLCFEIRDNGPGPLDETVDLFEPFYSTKPEGLGLGLALVKRATENLGGHVSWKREQGWTIFTMKVPV